MSGVCKLSDENDDRFQSEIERLRKEEDFKKNLFDKSIGDNAPRPSDQYIRACVGPVKDESQLHEEAKRNVQKQIDDEKRASANRAAVKQSMQEHHKRVSAQQEKVAEPRQQDTSMKREQAITRIRERAEKWLSTRKIEQQAKEPGPDKGDDMER